MLACPPGELHDVGLICFRLALRGEKLSEIEAGSAGLLLDDPVESARIVAA